MQHAGACGLLLHGGVLTLAGGTHCGWCTYTHNEALCCRLPRPPACASAAGGPCPWTCSRKMHASCAVPSTALLCAAATALHRFAALSGKRGTRASGQGVKGVLSRPTTTTRKKEPGPMQTRKKKKSESASSAVSLKSPIEANLPSALSLVPKLSSPQLSQLRLANEAS